MLRSAAETKRSMMLKAIISVYSAIHNKANTPCISESEDITRKEGETQAARLLRFRGFLTRLYYMICRCIRQDKKTHKRF
jgi:hypothetical protein